MKRLLATFLLSIFLCTCGEQSDKSGGAVDDAGYTPVTVLNKETETTYEFEVIGSIGSDVDTFQLFGNVSDLEIKDNVLFVLDLQFQTVTTFDASDLTYIDRRQILQGQGPGEMYGPIFFALDGIGNYFITSNQDFSIHIFDSDFIFLKKVQRFGLLYLEGANNEVHMVHQYRYKTDVPLVEKIDSEGSTIATYGKQHIDFENNYLIDNLQGTHHTYMTSDDSNIYLVYALPFEINQYSQRTYSITYKYVFSPSYIGGSFEEREGLPHYPTGKLVGVERFAKDNIILFSVRMKTRSDYTHYINMLDLKNEIYFDYDLAELNIGDFPMYTRTASSGGTLYINTIDPFPCIKAVRINKIIENR